MRYFKYLALLAVLALPTVHSQAQVAIGVRIGANYGLYNAPPVCAYGYYPDYPYGCAPYGYWGPEWFVDGVFIGAGPWYHFYYTHPAYYRPYYRRFYGGREFAFHGGFEHFRDGDRGFRERDREFHGAERFRGGHEFRGEERGFRGETHGFHGRGGETHRGGGEFHGGRSFHGEGGGHEGRR